jgi:hypothetical protein
LCVTTVWLVGCLQSSPLQGDSLFDPGTVYVSARFATDNGTAVPPEDAPITLTLVLVDDRFFDDPTSDRSCSLTLTTSQALLSDSALMDAVTDIDLFAAYTLDDQTTGTGECPESDAEVWGDLEQRFLQAQWSIGINALDDGVRRAVRSDTIANGDDFGANVEPFLLGGGFAWEALQDTAPGGYVANNRATAFDLLTGEPLVATDAAQVPDALWQIDFVFGVDASFALTTEPPR